MKIASVVEARRKFIKCTCKGRKNGNMRRLKVIEKLRGTIRKRIFQVGLATVDEIEMQQGYEIKDKVVFSLLSAMHGDCLEVQFL